MTTPRTIPADPKPGDRFMRQVPSKRGWAWQVEVRQPSGGSSLIASYISEADARLLVEGQARIAELEAALREYVHQRDTDDADTIAARYERARDALADLEVPK